MSVPSLPRGVRLHEDAIRQATVLLGPERALVLDDTGTAILREIDGQRSIATIAQTLAQRYQAPAEAVLADVTRYLSQLAKRRLIDIA